MVGGAVSTEELVPGYSFDYGGSAHILIRMTRVVQELELSRYGLHYIEVDPMFQASDGETPWFIYRDAERTIHELNEIFPGQGDAYRKFLSDWTPFADAVADLFNSAPGPLELGKMLVNSGKGRDMSKQLAAILRPYGDVARETFSEERVRAPLTWMAAQSGPPPSDPLSAPFLLWHPLYHQGGVARPKGGSGGLTKALKLAIEENGGDVFVNAPVKRILVENGQATRHRAGRRHPLHRTLGGGRQPHPDDRRRPAGSVCAGSGPAGARRQRLRDDSAPGAQWSGQVPHTTPNRTRGWRWAFSSRTSAS